MTSKRTTSRKGRPKATKKQSAKRPANTKGPNTPALTIQAPPDKGSDADDGSALLRLVATSTTRPKTSPSSETDLLEIFRSAGLAARGRRGSS